MANQEGNPAEDFLRAFGAALEDGSFIRLALTAGADPDLKKIDARRVVLKNGARLSLVYHHAKRDVTENLVLEDARGKVASLLGRDFKAAALFTREGELHLRFSRKGRPSLARVKTGVSAAGKACLGPREETEVPAAHNREKARLLDPAHPFLRDLGVTDVDGRVLPTMSAKWKQINKFLEIFAGALRDSGLADAARARVADFGSGKGYLTFAMHDYLRRVAGVQAEVTGVELRDDLVAFCNGVAERRGCAGLRFLQGDVSGAAPDAVDILVALHACDTATDIALHAGVRAGAAAILCAPCCHKELRPQMRAPEPLRALLRFGAHMAREADMVTDALRALLLEACGYKVSVFEFISSEHTSKNTMILALRRRDGAAGADAREKALAQFRELKAFYGIERQHLEKLLFPGGAVGAGADVQVDD